MANRAYWRFWAWECLHDTQICWWNTNNNNKKSSPAMIQILKRITGQSRHHRLRNIKTIDLCGIDNVRGAPKILRRIAEICPNVRSVSIPRCTRVQPIEIVDFLKALQLERLILDRTHVKVVLEIFMCCNLGRITTLELDNVDTDEMTPFFPQKMHLKSLKIRFPPPSWYQINKRDSSQMIYQKLVSLSHETLEILDIDPELYSWTPELVSAVHACTRLHTLHLSTTGAVEYIAIPDFVEYIASSFPPSVRRIAVDLLSIYAIQDLPISIAFRRNRPQWRNLLVGMIASVLTANGNTQCKFARADD